jgi:hypothetical protein
MASDAQFGVEGTRYTEPKQRSWLQTCLIGCLIIFVIMIVVAVLATIWVTHHWRGWASNLGSSAIKQAVDASDLAQQQKQAIGELVDRVADAFSSGRLSVDQMGSIMEKLARSPLMTSIMVTAADKKYLARSGLSDAEKAAGRETIRRFASGAVEKKIDKAGIDAAMTHISDIERNGRVQLRQTVSDDELRAFLAEAKVQADKAGIPNEPPMIDAAAEFKRIVDEAINDNPQPSPIDVPK